MTSWKDIRGELEGSPSAPAPAPAAEFWADFKARASLVSQETPRKAGLPVLWTSLAAAGLAALLAISLWPAPATLGSTHVLSLDVEAPHSAAMILNVVSENGRDTAAIVWVSGLEEVIL